MTTLGFLASAFSKQVTPTDLCMPLPFPPFGHDLLAGILLEISEDEFCSWYIPLSCEYNYVCHRLREIEMSEHDAEMYQRTLNKVRRQIQTLKIMLDTIQVNCCVHTAFMFVHIRCMHVRTLHFEIMWYKLGGLYGDWQTVQANNIQLNTAKNLCLALKHVARGRLPCVGG